MKMLRNRPADSCDNIRPLLSAYIDGRVTDDERMAVEQHLAGCAECKRELAQLRLVVSGLQALPQVPVPRSFALRRDEARVARAPVLGGIVYLRRAVATLAACLVLLLGANLYSGLAFRAAPAASPSQTAYTQPSADTSAQRESSPLAPNAGQTAPPSAPAGKGGPVPATGVAAAPAAAAAVAPNSTVAGAPAAAPAPAAASAPAPAAAQAPAVAVTPVAPPPTARAAAAAVASEATPAPPGEKAAVGSTAQASQPALASPATPTAPVNSAATPSQAAAVRPLWTAALVVSLALLLAVVGAFLGAARRGRG